jgi:hypothetical protein
MLRKLLSLQLNPTIAGKKLALPLIPLVMVLCCCGCFVVVMADTSMRAVGLLPTYTPSPMRSPAPFKTPTITPQPTAMPSQTSVPTGTATPTGAATFTNTPQPTDTLKPTAIPTPSQTSVPTGTATPTGAATFTSTPHPTDTLKPTAIPTPTPTRAPTNTPIPPTNTPVAGAPPGSEILADGVWRCPNSTAGAAYVGSDQSDKFHYLTCRWAQKIKDENRICFASRSAAVAYGYVPCGTCKP